MFQLKQENGNREKRYQSLLSQAQNLLQDERDGIANMANAASLLYHTLEKVNWAGFYILRGNELVLGPFMGLPACIRIPVEKGVCGTAVKKQATQLVPDVHQFPGPHRLRCSFPVRNRGSSVGQQSNRGSIGH